MGNFKEDIARCEAFVFDVDGVMTDGGIIPTPDGDFIRRYNAKDGYALAYAIKIGYKVCIITGGRGRTLENRLRMLGIDHFYVDCMDKITAIREYMAGQGLDPANVINMGDDIPDLECMREVGLPVCPADAAAEVIEASRYVSEFRGGEGAVRDIVEHVRDYARKRRRQITPVDLTQMSAKVVSSMRASNARVSFESEVPAGLFVEGDSLEIELVLRNLVKNAGESAAQADGAPRVVLAGERIGDEVVITVTDNGPVRTKAEIDAFLVPLRSEKSGGLGLGLAIVRRIIEAYGGTIVFDVVEPQGVRVEARLPARPDL